MSAIDPEKRAIYEEIIKRRSTFAPDKQAFIDELAKRIGIPDFSGVQSGSSTTPLTYLDQLKRNIGYDAQPLIGMGQKVMSTVQAGGQWVGDIPRQIKESVSGQPIPGNVYAAAHPNMGTTPRMTPTGRDPYAARNPGQEAGQVLGDIGMGTAAAVASGGASLPAQVAVGGLTGAMLNPDAPKVPAALGMAAPIVARVGSAIVKGLPSNKLTSADVNKWIGVSAKDVAHGADPGAQILEENLLGPTKAATHANVMSAFKDAGDKLDDVLKTADATGVRINNTDAVKNAIDNVDQIIGKRSDIALKGRINRIVSDLIQKHPNLGVATPSETQKLSADLGRAIKWNGYGDDINQVLMEIRGGVSSNLKTEVDGIEPVLRRWGNLKVGLDSAKEAIDANRVGVGTSANLPKPLTDALKSTVKRVAPYVIGGAIGGGIGARAIRAMSDLAP